MSAENASTRTEEALLLSNQICFRVYSLERAITAAYKPLLQDLGLTYPQYLVMLLLWEYDREMEQVTTVGRLCEALSLDTGTVSPLLKRMASRGLITRRRLKEDERTVVISLTAAGRALKQQALDVPGKLAQCLFAHDGTFDAERYLHLKSMLDEALSTLKESCRPPGSSGAGL